MAHDRQNARQQIEKLVHFFDSNIYQFKDPSFNETQARQQLIDPFFESLGWDMYNRLMQPLFRQEVVPESRMKSSTAREAKQQEPLVPKKDTLGKEHKEYASILDYIAEDEYKASSKEAVKKPDYRFRIGGQTKFFVEAKKPSVDLAKSQSAIFQVKRYGFSGRVSLAILTDFEEFRTFDCTQRPAFDKPKLGIIKDFDLTYKQYLDQFERLYDTFSRDAVVGGSLEALTKKMMLKRTGDFALDREFLEDLSKWREELARDIAKHPKNRRLLNDYTLNEAVQRILDRIVFIRVCEDREIEVENTLLAILRMWKERRGLSLYSLLNDLFKQRRALYNGLLFSPHPCEELEIGNEVLIKILENLNYPFSPYHFNEIGVEILGSIYEKFLGKTIHLTAKTTRIEEKPEVRKAGGVYYTPQYIVKYIVDNTLGKLLYEEDGKQSPLLVGEGQGEVINAQPNAEPPVVPLKGGQLDHRKLKLSPRQVSKLKIIDIACGSGSFLLGAFQKLIDYHIEWYTAHPNDIKTENNVPDAYKDTEGNYHLSPRKKRDILVNNIYGVDIDRQAVEVTQMSLYLKVLEGENAETLNPQMTLALKEVYLPSLAKNIKCGNSLIGTDFTSQGEMFDDEARQKVNPFDWEMEFPQILCSQKEPHPNPPLLGEGRERLHSGGFDVVIGNPPYGAEFKDATLEYLWKKYQVSEKSLDSYALFIEQAFRICKSDGLISYIVPTGWYSGNAFGKLRQYTATSGDPIAFVNLPYDIFDAWVDTTIFVFKKRKAMTSWPRKESCIVKIKTFPKRFKISSVMEFGFNNDSIDFAKWFDGGDDHFLTYVDSQTNTIIKKTQKIGIPFCELADIQRGVTPFKLAVTKEHKNSRLAFDGTVRRYRLEKGGRKYIRFDSTLAELKPEKYFQGPRLLLRELISRQFRLQAVKVDENYITNKSMQSILAIGDDYSTYYFLGILNSALLSFYFLKRSQVGQRDDFPKIVLKETRSLPIRTIDFNNPAEKKMHDDLVSLVEKMLKLNKQLQKAHYESAKEPIERQIAATDKKMDDIVYALYGLTEEEIKIVEGKS